VTIARAVRALAKPPQPALGDRKVARTDIMSINTERDIEANLQIGPTDQGMVRIFIEGQGIEIPMDFDPEEADEIADEIRAAAQTARSVGKR
jgi:hypothetical protein